MEDGSKNRVEVHDTTSKNWLLASIFLLIAIAMIFAGLFIWQTTLLSVTQESLERRMVLIEESVNNNNDAIIDISRIVDERTKE